MAELSERRNITRIGFSMLIMIVASAALQIGAGVLFADVITQENRFWVAYGVQFIPQYILAMPLAYLVLRRVPAETIERKKIGAGRLMTALLICYAIVFAGNLISLIITGIINAFSGRQMVNIVAEMLKDSAMLPNIIFLGIAAPVAEELFFRRLLIPRLARYGDRTAVIVSGLIFGLIHVNFSQFFYAFGIGLALGYIYVRTGKVIYTIALHIFINMIGGVIAPYIMFYAEPLAPVLGLIVLAMAIAGLVLYINNRKRIWYKPGAHALENWKKDFFLNEGIALFIIACAALFLYNTIFALT